MPRFARCLGWAPQEQFGPPFSRKSTVFPDKDSLPPTRGESLVGSRLVQVWRWQGDGHQPTQSCELQWAGAAAPPASLGNSCYVKCSEGEFIVSVNNR